jgi:hypothetical protein
MAEPGEEIPSDSELLESSCSVIIKDTMTEVEDNTIEIIAEPSIEEKFIIRQQPIRGKAIGFSQQFGNFLYERT